MPGEDVDPAALSVDRERNLWRGLPATRLQELDDDRGQAGMAPVQQAIHFAATPASHQLDPYVQRLPYATDHVEAGSAKVTSLDLGNRRVRYTGPTS